MGWELPKADLDHGEVDRPEKDSQKHQEIGPTDLRAVFQLEHAFKLGGHKTHFRVS
jgi:hypothetical protein